MWIIIDYLPFCLNCSMNECLCEDISVLKFVWRYVTCLLFLQQLHLKTLALIVFWIGNKEQINDYGYKQSQKYKTYFANHNNIIDSFILSVNDKWKSYFLILLPPNINLDCFCDHLATKRNSNCLINCERYLEMTCQ